MYKTYKETLNLIKFGNSTRVTTMCIPLKNFSLDIVSFFWREGFLKYYDIIDSKNSVSDAKIILHFKQIRRFPLIKDINLILKNKFSRKNLTYANIRSTYTYSNSYHVLLTTNGLFLTDSCLILKRGGILCFKIKI